MKIPVEDAGCVAAGRVASGAGADVFGLKIPNDDDSELAGMTNDVVVAGGGGMVNADVGEVDAAVVGAKLNGFAPVAGAPVCAGNENRF